MVDIFPQSEWLKKAGQKPQRPLQHGLGESYTLISTASIGCKVSPLRWEGAPRESQYQEVRIIGGHLEPAASPGLTLPPGACVLQGNQQSVIRWSLVSKDFSEIAGTGVL